MTRGIRKDCLGELEKLRNKLLEMFPDLDARNLCVLLGAHCLEFIPRDIFYFLFLWQDADSHMIIKQV